MVGKHLRFTVATHIGKSSLRVLTVVFKAMHYQPDVLWVLSGAVGFILLPFLIRPITLILSSSQFCTLEKYQHLSMLIEVDCIGALDGYNPGS